MTKRIAFANPGLRYTAVQQIKKGKRTETVRRTWIYQDDESLLEQISQNDEKALKVLEAMVISALHRLKSRYLACRVVEEYDLFQEVCLVIWEKKRKGALVLTGNLGGFIYGICRNKQLASMKKEYKPAGKSSLHRWKRREISFRLLDRPTKRQVYALADREPTFRGYGLERACAAVHRALHDASLSRQHCQVLEDFYFTDLSQKELAVKHGYKNENSVKVLQSKFLHGPFKQALLWHLRQEELLTGDYYSLN